MQDIPQPNQNILFAELKAENIELKAENIELKAEIIELKAANKILTERNEFLARLILDLQETVKELKDEINRLKGQKSRPKFPPATLNKGDKGSDNNAKQQTAMNPTGGLKKIRHEEIVVTPPNIPEGSRFKGYSDFHVEELNIEALKIKYRLAIYETPSGEILRGRLPFNLNRKHFGPDLIAYCLDQYHGRCVTRPQLLEQLIGFGVSLSSGELDSLLILDKDIFHEEKAAIFESGIAHSDQLNTDDTGARHNGRNGVCTHIGSPLFCYFESTFSKSRINFLGILRGRHTDYILSEDALLYAFDQGAKERHYRKFVSLRDNERELIDGIRDAIWNLYEQLKEYKTTPTLELRKLIENEFDGLFNCKTESNAINDLLKNTLSRRNGLLKVLDYPWLTLHNNDSERDIREYVKKRKISGSTRSELGRKARDTFASLKKRCRKLNVCFWDYLRDRTGKLGQIKPLSVLITEKARLTIPG